MLGRCVTPFQISANQNARDSGLNKQQLTVKKKGITRNHGARPLSNTAMSYTIDYL